MTELQAKLVGDACGNAYRTGFSDGVAVRDAQITRCKDCRWYSQVHKKADGTPNRTYKKCVCVLCGASIWRDPEWFCASGERLDEKSDPILQNTSTVCEDQNITTEPFDVMQYLLDCMSKQTKGEHE